MSSHRPETTNRTRDASRSRRLDAEIGRLRRHIVELERTNDHLEFVNAALERFAAIAAH